MSKDAPQKPILNPALRLLTSNKPSPPEARGKSPKHIINRRLVSNRKKLPTQIDKVKQSYPSEKIHAGRVIIFAEMYEDRLKPTLTPSDIFKKSKTGTLLIDSTDNGYLIESPIKAFDRLKAAIQTETSTKHVVDICSIKSIQSFEPASRWNKKNRVFDAQYGIDLMKAPKNCSAIILAPDSQDP